MSDRPRPEVADGEPYAGDLVAVVDESAHRAGSGLYYVVGAAVVLSPSAVTDDLKALVSTRTNPIHWSREGPAMREAVIEILCTSAVAAVAHWSSTGRRGQLGVRADLLARIVTWAHHEGVDHLVIESSDETINRRDRQTLARHPLGIEGVLGLRYDHRSKAEPLLWLADAVAGCVGDHLMGKGSPGYEKLVAAGVLPPI